MEDDAAAQWVSCGASLDREFIIAHSVEPNFSIQQPGASKPYGRIKGNYAFREHFWITTSGYFYNGPFRLTQEMFGNERLIFSVDYPFAGNRRAKEWFHGLDLAPETRAKIAHGTVDNLLSLR